MDWKSIHIAKATILLLPLMVMLSCFSGGDGDNDLSLNETGKIFGIGKYFLFDINIGTSKINRVSGPGLRGFSNIGGLALDPENNLLYGIDVESEILVKINIINGDVDVVGEIGFDRVEALAYDFHSNILFGTAGDSGNSHLIIIDTETGYGTQVGDIGYSSVFSLAFDPGTNALYGHTYSSDTLISINPQSGKGTYIGATGFSAIVGMSFDQDADTLYAFDSNNSKIIRIDTETGIGSLVGNLNYDIVAGLAFDSDSGILYGSDTATNFLLSIEVSSGETSIFKSLGFDSVKDLAHDPISNVVYGVDNLSDALVQIDIESGKGVFIGRIGFDNVSGIAFDPNQNKLYGSDLSTNRLLLIDTQTGIGTSVGDIGFEAVEGLAFDPNRNVLYGWSTYPDQRLLQIDKSTGIGTSYDEVAGTTIQSMAFDPDSNALYGNDFGIMKLIDTDTGNASSLFPFVFFDIEGITFDRIQEQFYCTNNKELITLNHQDRSERTIGSIGFNSISGLACNPLSSRLYGVDYSSGALVLFDTNSGEATVIADTATRITGLAYDSKKGILYGIQLRFGHDDSEQYVLVAVDTDSGATSTIGNTYQDGISSLACDSAENRLYGTTTRQSDNQLIEIDTDTGMGNSIGSLGDYTIGGLLFHEKKKMLYGSDVVKREIVIINPATGDITGHGPKTGAALNGLALVQ